MTLGLSGGDRARAEGVQQLVDERRVDELVALLDDPSWAVRRAVVAGLARVGDAAVPALCALLVTSRESEGRIAAAVDALSASGGDPTSAVLELAAHGNAAVVCDALQILGRRKARHALAAVAALANHADDNVAVAAIEAMSRIGGSETVEPLVAAVRGTSFFRKFPAVDALGRTGDPRAVEPLAALLDDPFYAAEATRALGRTGQEAAVAPLVRLLAKPSDATVRTAAMALTDLRDRHEARFGDASRLVELTRESAANGISQRISNAIHGAVASEQLALASVLGWLGDEPAVLRLIELVGDEGPLSTAAADALRKLGAASAPIILEAIEGGDSARRAQLLPLVGPTASSTAPLARCLEDPDPGVRVLACEALGRAGDTSVVASLFRLLGDRDARVAQAAAAAIQSLGSVDTRRRALLEARSTEPRVRRAALRIISYFGYPEGLDLMVEAMRDEDPKIREAAIQGLPLVDDPRALSALLEASASAEAGTRATAIRALGHTRPDAPVVDALRRALADEDAWVRYYACQALAKLKVAEATDEVIARIDDEAGQVRVGAVEALARLTSDAAVDALARVAQSADEDMRRAAIVGLGIARRAEYLPILRAALDAPDAATRLVAISAIAELDSPEVVPLLARSATDREESVRGAALGLLSTRTGNEATEALLAHLADPQLRERALAALTVAPDERIEGILGALETADAERATLLMTALTRMRRPSSFAAIAAALTFENVEARRAAVEALARVGTREAIELAERAVSDDPDPEVRRIGSASLRGR